MPAPKKDSLEAENARLKSEVERLQSEQRLKAIPVEAKLIDRLAELKAEVDRLTKAGDAMLNALQCSGCSECEGMYDCHDEAINEWNAAKEGKQP